MSNKIKVLLTYDYELPLGASQDYQKGLFEPAAKLFDLANELNVPLVMFADICSAIRFKDWDHQGYYLPFKNQLQQSLLKGHDVQLHIHPHWMNSVWNGQTFVPSPNFSLSGFKDTLDGYSIERVIEDAFREMYNMCSEVDKNYQCIAFRAGGYDVEPESKRILNKLYDLGIRIESSVIRDFYLDLKYSHIDYSTAPDHSHWFISKNGPLTKTSENRDMVELPISSKPVGLTDVMVRRIKKMANGKEYRSRLYKNGGKGFRAISGSQGLKSKYRSLTNPMVLTFDREFRTAKDLESVVKYQLKKYAHENNDQYITTIAHPKSMGSFHLGLMKEFIENLRKTYGQRVEFITYRQAYADFKF